MSYEMNFSPRERVSLGAIMMLALLGLATFCGCAYKGVL